MFLYKTVNQRVCVLARNDAPRDVAVMFSACECVCVCRSDSLAHSVARSQETQRALHHEERTADGLCFAA